MKIYTYPGIGDAYWVLMKIIPNVNEHIELKVLKSNYFRSGFLEHIQGVDTVEEFEMAPKNFKHQASKLLPFYEQNGLQPEMYLDCNTWLEAGKRIEDYLPQLNTCWRLGWKSTHEGIHEVSKILAPKKNVLLYTSSVKNNENSSTGNNWNAFNWVKVVDNLYREIPDINLIWIGGQPDTTSLDYFRHHPKMKSLVDASPNIIMQLMQNCDCFVSYQSGLSVMSVNYMIPTLMVYFEKIRAMKNAWCPLGAINNPKIYNPVYFPELSGNEHIVTDWVKGIIC